MQGVDGFSSSRTAVENFPARLRMGLFYSDVETSFRAFGLSVRCMKVQGSEPRQPGFLQTSTWP